MPFRLVALDEGPDILIDRDMVIVGRHPECDIRLDSIRISRRHCCLLRDRGGLLVRDLGSTNGIRINGLRVEKGRLRPHDELSIAHIRYRLEIASDWDGETVAGSSTLDRQRREPVSGSNPEPTPQPDMEEPIAAAVRRLLPAEVADRCQIQVIVKLPSDGPVSSLRDDQDRESTIPSTEPADSESHEISSAH